jgi:hypothetical protein
LFADLDALIRNDAAQEPVIVAPATRRTDAHTLHSTDQEQPTAANRYRHAGAPLTVWTDSTDQDWRRATGTRRAEVCSYIALIHLVLSFSTQPRLYAMPQR